MSYVHNYVVRGGGEFPMDMLRRDRSYPQTAEDADHIYRSLAGVARSGDPEDYTLQHVDDSRYWTPNEARWRSFGWAVLQVEVAA